MTFDVAILLTPFAMLALIGAIAIGRRSGRAEERARCLCLVSQSWQNDKKLSPTARRIHHSIEAGHEKLVSEDAFFGAEDPPLRLSEKERLVLGLLGDDELFGLDLVKASEGGAGPRLGRGTIYIGLDIMEERGLIESREEMGGAEPKRRLYKATALGKRSLGGTS